MLEHNVVIYKYSTILSYVIERFLDDHSEYIVRQDGNTYVFSRNYEAKYLVSVFTDYIHDFFHDPELHPFGKIRTVVIGTCYCHHNWLAEYADEITNDGNHRLLKSHVPIRYAFSDRRYVCDESVLNSIFDTLLSNLINRKTSVFTRNYNRVFWLFIKDIQESSLATLVAGQHHEAFIFPTRKSNILFDLNTIAFAGLGKEHRVSGEVKCKALYMYESVTTTTEKEK